MTDKTLDHVDEALDKVGNVESIHTHKKFFDKMVEDCGTRSHGAIDVLDPAKTPVVEGPLGSTKQLGRYASRGRVTPVYSHGKAEDVIHIDGKRDFQGGNNGGWFHEGKRIT